MFEYGGVHAEIWLREISDAFAYPFKVYNFWYHPNWHELKTEDVATSRASHCLEDIDKYWPDLTCHFLEEKIERRGRLSHGFFSAGPGFRGLVALHWSPKSANVRTSDALRGWGALRAKCANVSQHNYASQHEQLSVNPPALGKSSHTWKDFSQLAQGNSSQTLIWECPKWNIPYVSNCGPAANSHISFSSWRQNSLGNPLAKCLASSTPFCPMAVLIITPWQ